MGGCISVCVWREILVNKLLLTLLFSFLYPSLSPSIYAFTACSFFLCFFLASSHSPSASLLSTLTSLSSSLTMSVFSFSLFHTSLPVILIQLFPVPSFSLLPFLPPLSFNAALSPPDCSPVRLSFWGLVNTISQPNKKTNWPIEVFWLLIPPLTPPYRLPSATFTIASALLLFFSPFLHLIKSPSGCQE